MLLIAEIQNHNFYRGPDSLTLSLLYLVDINSLWSCPVLKLVRLWNKLRRVGGKTRPCLFLGSYFCVVLRVGSGGYSRRLLCVESFQKDASIKTSQSYTYMDRMDWFWLTPQASVRDTSPCKSVITSTGRDSWILMFHLLCIHLCIIEFVCAGPWYRWTESYSNLGCWSIKPVFAVWMDKTFFHLKISLPS